MWIFDLIAAAGCLVLITVPGIFAARRYQKLKHPSPTLQEEIEYYEKLNNELDRQQEVQWVQRFSQ